MRDTSSFYHVPEIIIRLTHLIITMKVLGRFTLTPSFLEDDTEIREMPQSHTVSDGVRILYFSHQNIYPNF